MKKLALIFLLFGLFLLFFSLDISFTGLAIGKNIGISNPPLLFFSLIFFIASAVLYLSHKSLEALVIPTGGTSEVNKKRVETAMKDYSGTRHKPYIIVSGVINRDERGSPLRDTPQYSIYKELRAKYGLKPSDITVEGKSEDTLENFLYSINRLKKKGINQIKIATNPTQYWRFKLFAKQAKRERLIDDSFKIEPLYTSETPREFFYGVLAYFKDYFRVKSADSLEKAAKNKSGNLGNFLKKTLT